MIKASQLRIGNIICYFNPQKQQDISAEVLGVCYNETLKATAVHTKDYPPINTNGIYPIPLTEEWLTKFGFEKKETYYYPIGYLPKTQLRIKFATKANMFWPEISRLGPLVKWNGEFADLGPNNEALEWFIIPIDLEFIHQFQNLYFALIGEELTIN